MAPWFGRIVLAFALLLSISTVRAHNGEGGTGPYVPQPRVWTPEPPLPPEPPPEPPHAPGAPPPPPKFTQYIPPRWSWIHWWEANRDRYLTTPAQDTEQKPDLVAIEALRKRAGDILIEAITQPQANIDLVAQGALALGKMRYAPAMPALQTLAEKHAHVQVRVLSLLGLGLMSTAEAETFLLQYRGTDTDSRVAAVVAIGLLRDVRPETRDALRAVLRDRDPAVASAVCWTLAQHPDADGLIYFTGLSEDNPSLWVASEAIVALGQYPDASPRLGDLMLGSPSILQRIAAYGTLEQIYRMKLTFVSARAAAVDAYRAQYAQYQKSYKDFWKDNPNKPAMTAAANTSVSGGLVEIGAEQYMQSELRASAAVALGHVGRPGAYESLLSVLQPKALQADSVVGSLTQSLAIMALSNYPSKASADRLARILGRRNSDRMFVIDVPRDSPTRGFAALALGLYARPEMTPQGPNDRPGFDAVIAVLTDRLLDENEDLEVRSACAVALGLTQRSAVLPALARASAQVQARHRKNDTILFGYLLLGRSLAADKNVIEPATKFLLNTPDDTTMNDLLARRAAVLALGLTHAPAAVPTLTRAWHLSYYVNREVILALRLVGATGASAPLMDALAHSKDPAERAYMALALGELLAPEHPTPLTRLIAETNFAVRNDSLTPLKRLANDFLYGRLIEAFGLQWR